MKETEYGRSTAIDFLRVVLCFLIVWNHTSNNILHGFLNPLSLAGGIGNQGFFFMSGYLYSSADIRFPYQWLKKRIRKIVKPYWIYLAVIIPVIWALRPDYLSFANILTAGACLQGFGPQIYPCGQHWFISYVLVCYCITPWLSSAIQKLETGGGVD